VAWTNRSRVSRRCRGCCAGIVFERADIGLSTRIWDRPVQEVEGDVSKGGALVDERGRGRGQVVVGRGRPLEVDETRIRLGNDICRLNEVLVRRELVNPVEYPEVVAPKHRIR